MRSTPLIATIAFALLFPSLGDAAGRGVEVTEKTSVHSGPSDDFFVVEKAFSGDKFELIEERKEWVKVKLEDGSSGWVRKESIRLTSLGGDKKSSRSDSGEPQAEVVRDRARLYAGPASSFVVVKRVNKGTRLDVLGESDDGNWLKVRLDGPPAWIRKTSVNMAAVSIPDESSDSGTRRPRRQRSFEDELVASLNDPTHGFGIGPYGSIGLGFAQIQHQLSTDGALRLKKAIASAGIAFEGGYWFDLTYGVQARVKFETAPGGFDIKPRQDRAAFGYLGPDNIGLDTTLLLGDVAGIARMPVWRVGTYLAGRAGWKFMNYDVQQVGLDTVGNDGKVENPAFYPATHQGPFVGAAFRMELADWIGVFGDFDFVPFAFVENHGAWQDLDTPSGDVTGDIGFSTQLGFYITLLRGKVDVDLEARFHFAQFSAGFEVDNRDDALRPVGHDYIPPYLNADSTEATSGGILHFTIR